MGTELRILHYLGREIRRLPYDVRPSQVAASAPRRLSTVLYDVCLSSAASRSPAATPAFPQPWWSGPACRTVAARVRGRSVADSLPASARRYRPPLTRRHR